MSWQDFYITYRDGFGQTLDRSFPELSSLPGELEGYASGLDATGRYENGGPLVLKLETGRRVISWLRALPVQAVGRAGAWEAWGVVGSAHDDPRYWPWYWTELCAGPGSVTRLAERLAKGGKSNGLPEPPLALPAILLAFQQQKEPPFVVMLREQIDLNLLPWVWLLGPVDPLTATLGPPRSRPHASRPFSYEAVWEPEAEAYSSTFSAAARAAAFSAQRIQSLQANPDALDEILAQHAGKGVPTAATPSATSSGLWVPKTPLQQARQQDVSMHSPDLGELHNETAGHSTGATPPDPKRGPQSYYYSAEEDGDQQTPGRWRRFFSRKVPKGVDLPAKRPVVRAAPPLDRRWLIAFAALLGSLVLLNVATLVEVQRGQRPMTQTSQFDPAKVPPPPKRPIPPSPTAPKDKLGSVCSSEFTTTTEQRDLATALVAAARSGKLKISESLEKIAVATTAPEAPPWQQSTRDRLVNAAIQVRLLDSKCLTVQQIDGFPGRRTSAALARCPDVSSRTEMDHLRWLCRWLATINGQTGSPPNRTATDANGY